MNTYTICWKVTYLTHNTYKYCQEKYQKAYLEVCHGKEIGTTQDGLNGSTFKIVKGVRVEQPYLGEQEREVQTANLS